METQDFFFSRKLVTRREPLLLLHRFFMLHRDANEHEIYQKTEYDMIR